jgi:hypothetical protein
MRRLLAGAALAGALVVAPTLTPPAEAMQNPCPGIRPCLELPDLPPMPWDICKYAYCQFP